MGKINKKVALVLNGPKLKVPILEEDIICADGGYNIVPLNLNIILVVGDMDSTEVNDIKTEKIVIPKEKDFSDGEFAVRHIKELNRYDEIVIYGALGGRPDHMLANLGLLELANEIGIKASIREEGLIITFESTKIALKTKPDDLISIIPTKTPLILENGKGLKYPIDSLVINHISSRGLSNVAMSHDVSVDIKKGGAFVFHFTK